MVSDSYHWNGDADKDVVKALHDVGVVGKVGGRAQLFVTTTTTTSSPPLSLLSSYKQKYIYNDICNDYYKTVKNKQKQQCLPYEGQMASNSEGKIGLLSCYK